MHVSVFYSLFLHEKKNSCSPCRVLRLRNLSIVDVSSLTFPEEAWIYLVSYFTVYSCAWKFNNRDTWLRNSFNFFSYLLIRLVFKQRHCLVRSIIIWFKEDFYITRFLWMFINNFQKIGLIVIKDITCVVDWVRSVCTGLNAFEKHYLHMYIDELIKIAKQKPILQSLYDKIQVNHLNYIFHFFPLKCICMSKLYECNLMSLKLHVWAGYTGGKKTKRVCIKIDTLG